MKAAKMGLKIMFRTCCGMPEGEPKIINAGVEFDLGVYIFIPCAAYSTVQVLFVSTSSAKL